MDNIIEHKVIRHRNAMLVLPSDGNNDSRFSRFYAQLGKRAAEFCDSEPTRLRSYRIVCRSSVSDGELCIELGISARLREKSGELTCRRRILRDTWRDGELILHERLELT